jgi:hypothetical protein
MLWRRWRVELITAPRGYRKFVSSGLHQIHHKFAPSVPQASNAVVTGVSRSMITRKFLLWTNPIAYAAMGNNVQLRNDSAGLE